MENTNEEGYIPVDLDGNYVIDGDTILCQNLNSEGK